MAATSKIIASTTTYPYQVIRARLQDHRGAHLHPGVLNVILRLWKENGMLGFYRGLVPNIVRVLPGTCITFAVYETLSMYFKTRARVWKDTSSN